MVVAETAAAGARRRRADRGRLRAAAGGRRHRRRRSTRASPRCGTNAPATRCFDWEIGDRAAVERAAAAARHRVSLTLVNNRIVVNSMEPRGAIGEYDPGEDAYTLWSSTQGSHFLRNLLAEHVFQDPGEPHPGGDAGCRRRLRHEAVPLSRARPGAVGRQDGWAGRSNGSPTASDAFMTDTQGRDNIVRLDLALDEELRFLGLSVELIANMGAYLSNFAPEIPTASGAVMYSGVYAIPAIHVAVKGVFTNTVPVDAYRGAGRPEAAYAVERLVDHAARQLGVAPDELRRRNFIRPEAMPHTTPLGLNYDSGDFARNMDQALAAADAAGFAGAAGRGAGARPLSRARPRRLYRAVRLSARRIRRAALRPVRHVDAADGHAILGAGPPDRLRAAGRRAARPAARQDPGVAGRHRMRSASAAAPAARARCRSAARRWRMPPTS